MNLHAFMHFFFKKIKEHPTCLYKSCVYAHMLVFWGPFPGGTRKTTLIFFSQQFPIAKNKGQYE